MSQQALEIPPCHKGLDDAALQAAVLLLEDLGGDTKELYQAHLNMQPETDSVPCRE